MFSTKKTPSWEELLNSLNNASIHPEYTVWNIYYYMKEHLYEMESIEARTLLTIYMMIPQKRPSLLHSKMLEIALAMHEIFIDFRFARFLYLWGFPHCFREEDKVRTYEHKECLMERVGEVIKKMLGELPKEECVEEEYDVSIIGYVDYIDLKRGFIHIYDNKSRHFVAKHCEFDISKGAYVKFIPVIPIRSKFKSALITSIVDFEEGTVLFGLRRAEITDLNIEKCYAKWKLQSIVGNIGDSYICEEGTDGPRYKEGYIYTRENNLHIGDEIKIIVFLKRSKDGIKRPYVVYYRKSI